SARGPDKQIAVVGKVVAELGYLRADPVSGAGNVDETERDRVGADEPCDLVHRELRATIPAPVRVPTLLVLFCLPRRLEYAQMRRAPQRDVSRVGRRDRVEVLAIRADEEVADAVARLPAFVL